MFNVVDSFVRKFVCLYFVLVPIFRYYDLPGGSNLWLLIINVFVLFVFVKNMQANINVSYLFFILLFLFYIAARSFLAYHVSPYKLLISETSINNFIVLLDCFILVVLLGNIVLDCSFFIKAYHYMCLFIIIFLVLQMFCYFILHIRIDGNFLSLKLNQAESIRHSIYFRGFYTQFSSVFMEPSHLAQYLAPYLCLNMYGYKEIIKRSLVKAMVISLLMFASVSGSAICMTCFIWLVYMIQQKKYMTNSRAPIYILGLYLFFIIFMIIPYIDGIGNMIDSMMDSSSNKTSDRVTRGFLIWFNLPIIYKFFGIGYQCVFSACSYFNIELGTIISNGHNEYVNDVASILVSFGLVGITPVIFLLKYIFSKKSEALMLIGVCLLAIFISEATLGVMWITYILIGICVYKSIEKI